MAVLIGINCVSMETEDMDSYNFYWMKGLCNF